MIQPIEDFRIEKNEIYTEYNINYIYIYDHNSLVTQPRTDPKIIEINNEYIIVRSI